VLATSRHCFFFFFVYSLYSCATYLDHDEFMYSPFPGRKPREAALCKHPLALRPGLSPEQCRSH